MAVRTPLSPGQPITSEWTDPSASVASRKVRWAKSGMPSVFGLGFATSSIERTASNETPNCVAASKPSA
jgi:hypothetical protein